MLSKCSDSSSKLLDSISSSVQSSKSLNSLWLLWSLFSAEIPESLINLICWLGLDRLGLVLDDDGDVEDIKKDLSFMVPPWSLSWYGTTFSNNSYCPQHNITFKGLFSCHERFGLEKRLQYWITTLTPGASALHSRTDDSVIITGGFYLYYFGVRSKNYWYFFVVHDYRVLQNVKSFGI